MAITTWTQTGQANIRCIIRVCAIGTCTDTHIAIEISSRVARCTSSGIRSLTSFT